MKEVRINPGSALFGAGLLALVLVAVSAQHVLTNPTPQTKQWPVEVTQLMRIEGIPAARDMVVVREGEPYTVPEGKLFVLTGLGVNSSGLSGSLWVDGVREAATTFDVGNGSGWGREHLPSVIAMPAGFTANGGQTVEARGGFTGDPNDARAWGYLADA